MPTHDLRRTLLLSVRWSVPALLLFGGPALAQTAASAPDLTTFPYLPQRTQPTGADDAYGFAFDRPALPAGTSQDQRFEFNANWGNRAIGQAAALNAPATPSGAPVNGLTGRGVTVAVIDSGIDATFRSANAADGFSSVHPEFLGRIDIRSRAFPANAPASLDIQDRDGHGTHVAGTIGAAQDGVGMLGVAPNANLLILKGIGAKAESAFDSDAALAYAASLPDVRIINGSYGPSLSAGATTWNTGNLDDEIAAVRAALAAGKILVYANGNDYSKAPVAARNPSGVPLFPYIRPANAGTGVYRDGGRNYDFSDLARLPGSIVAVANVDSSLRISDDSNRCGVTARWCVSAPGGGTDDGAGAILSAYPRSFAGTVTAPNSDATYKAITGTSMATPHASGMLAVLIEAYPGYSSLDIVRLLFATAQDLGAPGIDEVYGHGLIRLDRALSAPNLDAAAPATTATLSAGESRYWSAPVTAAGSLTVTGAGAAPGTGSELVVAGRTTLRGTVRAEAVDIEVDGVLTTPLLTIARNASLSGEGDVFGNVDVQGTLSPGSGNWGDLVVHGDLTLGRNATFHAVIDGSESENGTVGYSVAVVTGAGHAFTAAGALVFDMVDMPVGRTVAPIGTKFPVVLAEDGARIQGRFDTVSVVSETGPTGLPAASRIDLLYRVDAIVGAVTPAAYANLEANGVGLTARQRAVAGALDRSRPEPGGAMTASQISLFDPLFGRAADALPGTFQQLSGAGSSATAQAAVDDSRRFTSIVGQRLSALRSGTAAVQGAFAPSLTGATSINGGLAFQPTTYAALGPVGVPAEAGSAPAQAGTWGLGFGSGLRIGADASGPGLRAQGGGLAVGVDRILSPGLVAGGAFGYAHSTVAAAGTRGIADSYLGAGYLGFASGGVEVDASAGLGYAALTATRQFAPFDTVLSARSKTDGLGALASIEAGYRFSAATEAGTATLKPLAAFAYNDLHRGRYAEAGAGALGLAFSAQTFGRATTLVGAEAGVDIAAGSDFTVRPSLRLGWTHDLIEPAPALYAALLDQPFRVRDARPGRDGVLVNADITVWSSRKVSVFAGYRGEVRANAASHQGNAGLRIIW